MNVEGITPIRTFPDFNKPSRAPEKIEAEIVLVEMSADGFNPKAYSCSFTLKNDFILLGEVQELHRGTKTLILIEGTCVYYSHLIIISKNDGQDQKEEFYKALQSLHDAIRISSKFEVKDKMNSNQHETRKLRAMIKSVNHSENNDGSLDAIKNSNKQTDVKESQNSLFELHL